MRLAGVAVPKGLDGRSLKPVLDGKVKSVHAHVFGYFRDFQRMIRTDEWKLIHYPHVDRLQLFHLKTDPNELTNLAVSEKYTRVRKELLGKLRAWQKRVGDPVLQNKRR